MASALEDFKRKVVKWMEILVEVPYVPTLDRSPVLDAI
jgi:hypothetical protein